MSVVFIIFIGHFFSASYDHSGSKTSSSNFLACFSVLFKSYSSPIQAFSNSFRQGKGGQALKTQGSARYFQKDSLSLRIMDWCWEKRRQLAKLSFVLKPPEDWGRPPPPTFCPFFANLLHLIFHRLLWTVSINTEQKYIQKAGFAGSQKPQINLNFPQKDCLRTQKLSIPWPRGFKRWSHHCPSAQEKYSAIVSVFN